MINGTAAQGQALVNSGKYAVPAADDDYLADDPGPAEPSWGGEYDAPSRYGHTERQGDDDTGEPEPTTWEPIDLGPYLRGEHKPISPTVGMRRSDGVTMLYPGKEHVIAGKTESAKSWFALQCVATEIAKGTHVVYIHYEEGDAASTVERLLLDVDPADMLKYLKFVAPSRSVRAEFLTPLLTPAPTLVVHDGVNEAMSINGQAINDPEGASAFRTKLIRPCLKVGAATLACDHLTHNTNGYDAFGSVHKGNAIDGARFILENKEPFGRDLKGASHLFITKDRPGHLRRHGTPDKKTPGKTFMGTLVVDARPLTETDEFSLNIWAPSADNTGHTKKQEQPDPIVELAKQMARVVAELPNRQVRSLRDLKAAVRAAKIACPNAHTADAAAYAIRTGLLEETPGRQANSFGYKTPHPE